MFKFLGQEGQALLVVVLAMVVVLTVGLSVVSRSVTNLRNSQQEIDSQKALSAAEAGVEQAIKSGTSITEPINFSAQTSYKTSSEVISGASDFLLNGNNKVSKDDAMYIWLTPYSTDPTKLFQEQDRWSGSLSLYWGNSSAACDRNNADNYAALEIAVVSGARTAPVIKRYVYDPCPDRITRNNFSSPDSINANYPISGVTLYDKAQVPHITNGFLVRVVPLYADSNIGVSGVNDDSAKHLPPQGTIITSTGTTNSNVVRKLDVFQGYPEIPAELFPFTIFWP
jgi:hypothetical protein